MAWDSPDFKCPGLTAAADLSTKQFYCVRKNATAKEVALCSTEGETVFGVLYNKPTSGEAAEVVLSGVAKVLVGTALTSGDFWGTDSAGKAIPISVGQTGQDIGQYAAGQVIVGAAAGEYATVTIGNGFRVPNV